MGAFFMDLNNTDIGIMLQRIKTLDAGQIFVSVMRQKVTQEFLVKLNTDQLRWQFVNSEGKLLSDIGGGYSNFTLSLGKKQGKFKVDLYDTGEYHESFRIENISASGFDIESDSNKGDVDLKEEWGEEIEGLTFESVQKAAEFMLNLYFESILTKIAA